ncbi:hypothetical protein HO133_006367 [Letharia lupina]|uniref:Uncharacterized protein n=1 Tax=Letharia lupina TaxID=560253 RepID=A0A8H6F7C6_9LECA|nr:uncharacterized protein HO133_006367 [Letharia lupina]KAF6217955.1 hypothetical protein HO133_006367 [Letharia lupina]
MQVSESVAITTEASQVLPPLLALPLELKQQIFNHLSNDDEQGLSLTILRRTHPIFRHVIPRQQLSPITPYNPLDKTIPSENYRTRTVRQYQLSLTERKHPYLFAPDHYPCYSCCEVLGVGHFEDDGIRDEFVCLKDLEKIPLGSPSLRPRICDRCLAAEMIIVSGMENAQRRSGAGDSGGL